MVQVQIGRRDFWWLVGLEATLFASLPCWEATAPYAEPATFPFRFGLIVLLAATLATLACHVVPAFFAARYQGTERWFWWLLLPWLGFGYLDWLITLVRATQMAADRLPGITVMLLAVALFAGLVRQWWKPVAVAGILLGTGILALAIATTSHGLHYRNPHYSAPPEQLDWVVFKGMLLAGSPAVVLGWQIGRIEPQPRHIWLSGFVGLWIPLFLSVTVASLADQAGANLFWRPSLFRGFNWAILGVPKALLPAMWVLLNWTQLWPAVLSIVSLRLIGPLWRRPTVWWQLPLAVCTAAAAVISSLWLHRNEFGWVFQSSLHEGWAASLVAIGVVAGLHARFRRST
jgi:hypothetical protein